MEKKHKRAWKVRHHLTFRSVREPDSRAFRVCGDSLEVTLTGKLLIWLILMICFESSTEMQHVQAVLPDDSSLWSSSCLLPCLSTYSVEKDLSIFSGKRA